ncbi:MAG TPA: GNAT family protein [Ktedonobacteraceae bacterium]|nr:GNAT family protein [Ktedonobacteraceae bacterium]
MIWIIFRERGLRRIWAWSIAENIASARVLKKIGMRQEGHLRDHVELMDDTISFSF